MRDGKLCFGLVGLGMGGETHARQIARLEGATLLAVYGRNADKAKAFATNFNVPHAYSRLEDLLGNPEIDVVNICTPNGLHLEFAAAAADAGKHLIVEKPLEITLPRAQAIIAACRKNRVQLGVIFQMRFGQAARRLKAAIESGKLGRLLAADVIDKEYRPPKYYATDAWRGTKELEGGGCLMTQSIHVLDLLQWLAGPVVSVFAKKRTALHDIEVEDLLAATLCFANGAIGVFESSTAAYPAFKSRVEIHGSEGSAIINGEWDETFFWDVKSDAEKLDAVEGFKFADVSEPRLMPEDRHLLEFADMAAAIRSGRAPSVTGEEALRSLAIAMSLYESADTGKEVLVKDILARDGIPAWW